MSRGVLAGTNRGGFGTDAGIPRPLALRGWAEGGWQVPGEGARWAPSTGFTPSSLRGRWGNRGSGQMTRPRPHSWPVAKPGLDPSVGDPIGFQRAQWGLL